MDALVTDVAERGAVAGLRGLGAAGFEVLALGSSRTAAGLWSRFATDRAIGPDSTTDPDGFMQAVGDLARRRGPLFVYPGLEESIDALVDHQDELPAQALIPYSGSTSLRALRDKVHLPTIAQEAGLPMPETLAVGAAGRLSPAENHLPCVIKAVTKVGGGPTAWIVNSLSAYEAVLSRLDPEQVVIVQQLCEGPLASLSLVVDRNGGVVARFQQVALSTWPPGVGPSQHAVSVPADPDLTRSAGALLARAGFWGLAQLQFVGGTLIDVNPRFYGSLPLALRCGVNLPAAWHAVATGSDVKIVDEYPVGIRFRWLEADILAALHGSPRKLFKPQSGPGVGAMWRGDDPWPGILLGGAAAGAWVRRRLPR
ncbi:MAG: hypothetical protein NVSMB25_07620 [Thermoleophilaceae bacterium]